MKNLELTREQLLADAERIGKDPIQIERAVHLLRVLEELHLDADTTGKFALRGGTALNLFHGAMPRISQDIDLDYVARASPEMLQSDRTLLPGHIKRILEGLGYTNISVPHGTDHNWTADYESVMGGTQKLEIDISYFNRVPVYEEQHSFSAAICGYYTAFPVLNINDLLAGKFNALFNRGTIASRDIFDLHRIISSGFNTRSTNFRIPFLIETACHFSQAVSNEEQFKAKFAQRMKSLSYGNFLNDMRKTLSSEAFKELSTEDGLTRARFEEIKETISRSALQLLQFTEPERKFVKNIIEKGEINPDLITSSLPLQDREPMRNRIANNSYLNFICKAIKKKGFESREPVHHETIRQHPIQKRAKELGITELDINDCHLVQKEARVQARRKNILLSEATDNAIKDIKALREKDITAGSPRGH